MRFLLALLMSRPTVRDLLRLFETHSESLSSVIMYHTVLFVLFLASPPFLPNLTASLLFFLILIAY